MDRLKKASVPELVVPCILAEIAVPIDVFVGDWDVRKEVRVDGMACSSTVM